MVRARQTWLFDAQAKHGDRVESEEDPDGEDEERIELFVGPGQGEYGADSAKKNQRAAGCACRRVNPLGEAEEDAVAGHGEGDARAGKNHDVECAERGDGHCHRQPCRAARACECLNDVGRDVLRARYVGKRQDSEIDDVCEQIQSADRKQSENDGARNILSRVDDFFAQDRRDR